MDRTERLRNWRRNAWAGCLAVMSMAAGCTQEVNYVGPAEVRMQEESRTTLARATIFRDGESVGSVRTMRVRGPSGVRTVHQVQDNYSNALGYIDEQNCAFRFSAHAGSELVGNSSDRRRNVAAILGAFGSEIDLIEEAPAAVYDRAATSPSSGGR
jgi:hypothetical protein